MKRLAILAAGLIAPVAALGQAGGHGAMMHGHGDHAPGVQAQVQAGAAAATEPGQAAFAAIAEIVAILEADPATDWSAVDIEALRRHLVDMDLVTLRAEVAVEEIEEGAVFRAGSQDPEVREAIRRMTLAHAATMDGVGGWRMAAEETGEGAALRVTGEAAKIRALGFLGVLTLGMHHPAHHLALARGGMPH